MHKSGFWQLIALIGILTLSCSSEESAQNRYSPRVVGITVANMENSMNWYTTHLHFERDTVMSFPDYGISVGMMHLGEFYLELVTFENGISKNSLDLPANTEIDGFFKIGFAAKDIEALFRELSAKKEIEVLAPLDQLPKLKAGYAWPEQYFLVTDPDGNYIQFFSPRPGQPEQTELLSPFLIALSTPDMDQSIDWYTKHLGARLIDRVGNEGNLRAILDKDGFILELGEFDGYIPFDSLNTTSNVNLFQVHGIRKLSIMVEDITSPYKALQAAGISFDFELTEQQFAGSDRYFMISDNFGNSLQFLHADK